MRAVLQRVKEARVNIEDRISGEIGEGLLILLGISREDDFSDIHFLIDKIKNLRIFEDENEKMNLSLLDIKAEILIVSQFTLYADCRKGRRPDFIDAAAPEKAKALYEQFVNEFKKTGLKVETGEFQAMMDVSLINSGPVTIILDSK